IARLKPDLVVTATTANPEQAVLAVERLGVPVYVTKSEGLAELDRTIADLGQLCNAAAGARALTGRIHAAMAELRVETAARPRGPALIIVWSDPLFVVGPHTYTDELLGIAGGRNAADDAGPGFPKYPLERVLHHAPSVMILGSHKADDPSKDPFVFWRRFPERPAVRTGRLHSTDGDLIFRPGPRVSEGARALAKLLHPEDIDAGRPF